MTWVRRVVTGHDGAGQAVIVSDGPPSKTVADAGAGFGVSEVLAFDRPPTNSESPFDSPADPSFGLQPPPGGATVRVIRLPPPPPDATGEDRWLPVPGHVDPRRGWHTTHTLDVEVVLSGQVVLGLDDGERLLSTGDAVVQRGTGHRWRVEGNDPCVYLVLMAAPEEGEDARGGALEPRAAPAPDAPGPRRLVTGSDARGASFAELDGPPPVVLRTSGPHGGTTLSDVWQTGGPLLSVDQGGDVPGGWSLAPAGRGIAVRMIELPAGHDPGENGWHVTDTIDVDVVIDGRLGLELPGAEPVALRPGDVVVQRRTVHRWRPLGDGAVRFAAVMFALR